MLSDFREIPRRLCLTRIWFVFLTRTRNNEKSKTEKCPRSNVVTGHGNTSWLHSERWMPLWKWACVFQIDTYRCEGTREKCVWKTHGTRRFRGMTFEIKSLGFFVPFFTSNDSAWKRKPARKRQRQNACMTHNRYASSIVVEPLNVPGWFVRPHEREYKTST